MILLDHYLGLQKQIYDYFGYEEDWRVLPIDDRRKRYWRLGKHWLETQSDAVIYADSREDLLSGNDDAIYSDVIWTYRHLPKHVYRGEEFTMVVVDTMTDGNKFLAIFDNSKEVKA